MVLNANCAMPLNVPNSVTIGKNVQIGAGSVVYSSIVDDDCVIEDNVVV